MSDNQDKNLTGIEKARATSEQLKKQNHEEKVNTVSPVEVAHHSEVALNRGGINITGFEDIPSSIIPLPFYKLVSQNSRNVTVDSDGTRAEPGNYYTDLGEEVQTVRVAIIRAKRGTKTVKNNGIERQEPTINILAVDTSNMSPFLISISKGSFSNFGRMMNHLIKKGAKHSFDFPVVLAADFVEGKEFSYWANTFSVEDKPFEHDDLETMAMVYNQYAAALDRGNWEEEKKPGNGFDSAGNKIKDIDFGNKGEESEEMPF